MFGCCSLRQAKYIEHRPRWPVDRVALDAELKRAVADGRITQREAERLRAKPCKCMCHVVGAQVMC